jgi:hypothetical protein
VPSFGLAVCLQPCGCSSAPWLVAKSWCACTFARKEWTCFWLGLATHEKGFCKRVTASLFPAKLHRGPAATQCTVGSALGFQLRPCLELRLRNSGQWQCLFAEQALWPCAQWQSGCVARVLCACRCSRLVSTQQQGWTWSLLLLSFRHAVCWVAASLHVCSGSVVFDVGQCACLFRTACMACLSVFPWMQLDEHGLT